MAKIVVLGEALIDVFAEKGVPLRAAKALYPSPGGAPANVAVALARLGADVGFIGKVGIDDYGRWLIDLLHDEGVDTTHFVADPRAPTMLAIVASPSATEQHFVLYDGANALLAAADLPETYITGAAVFVFGSVTLASASRDATLQAARFAHAAGRQVVFDVNLRPALWPDLGVARQWIDECVALATVLKLNEVELEFLTGTGDPARGSEQLMARGIQLCCVSLGADGTYFNNGSASGHVPAFPIEVRDTTGSGDAFVAGLAFGLAKLEQPIAALSAAELRRIIALANACGALAATEVGAMSASPTLDAVEELLRTT